MAPYIGGLRGGAYAWSGGFFNNGLYERRQDETARQEWVDAFLHVMERIVNVSPGTYGRQDQ